MLHDYVGDDAFRKGLHNYLTEYSYKNTVTENLWSHLAKASNKPVNEVMSSWTLQMGYPLLTVTEEQTNKNRILKIKQQRFIADGSADDENLQWKIPITIFTKSNPNKISQQILMDKPEISLTLDNISEDDWFKLNFNSIGLYRVKYESKSLARLNEPIAQKSISPRDRLMIQNDVAALCNAGHESFVDYLKLLSSYKDEDNFTVWKAIGKKMKQRIFLYI
jgi:puromycin-sensitive aminopeptidase